MAILNVLGFDPSLRNWGIAAGKLDTGTSLVDIRRLLVLRIPEPVGKQVRQNTKDLIVSEGLFRGAHPYAEGARVAFAEIPVGSQSARSMASYGVCCGVLGSLRGLGCAFIEVMPLEVKMATVGKKTASKREMIEWAMAKYPNAPWPYHNGKLNEGMAEHMADACAAIEAGIKTSEYQQLAAMLR